MDRVAALLVVFEQLGDLVLRGVVSNPNSPFPAGDQALAQRLSLMQ